MHVSLHKAISVEATVVAFWLLTVDLVADSFKLGRGLKLEWNFWGFQRLWGSKLELFLRVELVLLETVSFLKRFLDTSRLREVARRAEVRL